MQDENGADEDQAEHQHDNRISTEYMRVAAYTLSPVVSSVNIFIIPAAEPARVLVATVESAMLSPACCLRRL